MTKCSLAPLEFALIDALPGDPARIAAAARKLSHAFTSERSELHQHYLTDPDVLSAYLAAFLLPNAEKVLHCLSEADALGALPASEPFEVLDLGSGPATASLAASLFFAQARPRKAVRFLTVEGEATAARAGEKLFATIAPQHHAIESIVAEIDPGALASILEGRRFDLIVAANVLNELSGADAPFELCRTLLSQHLAEGGALLIIDPALRETTRPLMALRDRLLAEGVATVAAPCLHQERCPMLAGNERDWCHFYLDWQCPQLVAHMDAISGMRHRHLKMAYLLLMPAVGREARMEPDLWRVVSSPLDSKGKRELVLCGVDGELCRIRRMHRDASEANNDLDEVVRGDVVRCGAQARITRDDAFAIVRRWRHT